ncbi:MAG: hypothetical protein NT062_28790, partial [Proteobacteria bacterium]|nr:hypothetical protein [Pseudomonadota bacterium]
MNRWKVFVTCVGLVGVGCGDDGQRAASDAPPGDVLTPIPVTITITTLGAPPELIAYRVVGGSTPGPWQALDKAATQFAVAGPAYELLAVCQQGAAFTVGIRAERVADEISPFLPCYAYAPVAAPPAPVAVGGQMTTAGTVVLGSSASSETAPWTFALEATPGLHELIAFGANKYVVRTGVDITA